MGVELKFCGLTRDEDVRLGSELGADYLGVILAGGPRRISAARAAELFGELGHGRRGSRRVGVFGAVGEDAIAELAAEAGLDVVQLHGDPDAEVVDRVRRRYAREVWAVLRVGGTDLPPAAAGLFDAADAVVLDAKVAGALGGTGIRLEWRALREAVDAARGRGRLVLAGGLTPENVREAIAALAPDVVDVSSGVELGPGVKDHRRMRDFAAAVRGSAAGGDRQHG